MIPTLIGLAMCITPLIMVWLGYLWGRYGLPYELRKRRIEDRRAKTDDDTVTEVYRHDSMPESQS
jgi:hypothetical protein